MATSKKSVVKDLLIRLREWFKSEDMLPNGCLPSGHKFSSYEMCTICGGYK